MSEGGESSTAPCDWTFLENLDIGDLASIDESVDLLRSDVGYYLVLEDGERIGPYATARAAVESGPPDTRVVGLLKELDLVRADISTLTRERDEARREVERLAFRLTAARVQVREWADNGASSADMEAWLAGEGQEEVHDGH